MNAASVDDAVAISVDFAKAAVRSVTRFANGLAHYVYDVECDDNCRFVIRIGRPNDRVTFDGAEYWSNRLRPLGVPLPAILARGEHRELPFIILERLPGSDLGDRYADLSTGEKRSLAAEIVRLQRIVGTLPSGSGYGFARHADGPFSAPTWPAVLDQLLARSRRQIDLVKLVDTAVVDRVEACLDQHRDYFDQVRPTPFLDDLTTKNVIVDTGRLSGVVDVDALCFGDPLLTVALTQMALLSAGLDTDYVEFWCEELALSGDQRMALRLYTAVHCAGFLSELGHAFNRDTAPPFNTVRAARLYRILDDLLAS